MRQVYIYPEKTLSFYRLSNLACPRNLTKLIFFIMGSVSIAGVTGEVIVKDAPGYHGLTGANAQYATSSYGAEHEMNPGMIVKQTSAAEI